MEVLGWPVAAEDDSTWLEASWLDGVEAVWTITLV